MRTEVRNSFAVAIWFLDRARVENSYLQPRALQSILFIAQGIFAARNEGRLLMPSLFVMDHSSPVDPNLYLAFENGRPAIEVKPLAPDIVEFLQNIWIQFGQKDALALEQWIDRRRQAAPGVRFHEGSVISQKILVTLFSDQTSAGSKSHKNSAIAEKPVSPVGSTVISDGRPVRVEKWEPGMARKSPAGQ